MSDEVLIRSLNFALLKSAEKTAGGVDRYIQPLVESGRKLNMTLLRTVSSADSADISGIDAWTHGLTVNDEPFVVVQLAHASSVGVAKITPAALDASGKIVLFDTKERGVGAAFAATDTTDYYSPRMAWPVTGVAEVFFMVSELAPGDTVKIYGGLI